MRGLRSATATCRMVLLLMAVWLACGTPAGATPLLAELDTASPAATLNAIITEQRQIQTLYLEYRVAPTTARQHAIAERLLRLGGQVFDMREVPPATRGKVAAAAVGYLSDILARLPTIPPADVPGANGWSGGALPAHWTIPGTELRLVRLPDGPRAGDYVFSAATLANLPAFHARIASEPVLHPDHKSDWAATQNRVTGPWLAPLALEKLPHPLAGDGVRWRPCGRSSLAWRSQSSSSRR